jgi:hypothetical protein
MASDDRFAFNAEWFDTMAGLIRTYTLLYYPSDNTIEMVLFLSSFDSIQCKMSLFVF